MSTLYSNNNKSQGVKMLPQNASCPPLNLDALKRFQSPLPPQHHQSSQPNNNHLMSLNNTLLLTDKLAKDPLFYKQAPLNKRTKQTPTSGFETTRAVTAASPSSASLLYTISHQPTMIKKFQQYQHHNSSTNLHHHTEEQTSRIIKQERELKTPQVQHFQRYDNSCQQDSQSAIQDENVKQIKSELKDKIMMTRERFNQLKQRKRNQVNSIESTQKLSQGLQTVRSQANIPLTYRSSQTSNLMQDNSKERQFEGSQFESKEERMQSIDKQDESFESDQISRDEETYPLDDNTPIARHMQSANIPQHIYKEIDQSHHMRSNSGLYKLKAPNGNTGRTSYYRSYQSMANLQQHRMYFKMEAAKQLAQKVSMVYKSKYHAYLEELRYFQGHQYQQQDQMRTLRQGRESMASLIMEQEALTARKEKWKFVKSVVKSIEKQKKQKSIQDSAARPTPLQDRTQHHLNSTNQFGRIISNNIQANDFQMMSYQEMQQQNYSQIKDLFEHFKPGSATPAISGLIGQENIYPARQKSAGNIYNQNIVHKRKNDQLPPSGKRQLMTQKINYRLLDDDDEQVYSDELNQETYHDYEQADDRTYRALEENEFDQKNNIISTVPTQMLTTSRSHIMATEDEELAEGSQQLPMESPAGAGKFMSRTRMYLNEFISQHYSENHIFNKSLSKLAQNNLGKSQQIKKTSGSDFLKFKEVFSRLIYRQQMKADKQRLSFLQNGFAKLKRNCHVIRKFHQFLLQQQKRIQERVFDKLKKLCWEFEERKLALEEIIMKRTVKEYLVRFKHTAQRINKMITMISAFEKQLLCNQAIKLLKVWHSSSVQTNKQSLKVEKLNKLVQWLFIYKSGFAQYKDRVQKLTALSNSLIKINRINNKLCKTQALKQWRQFSKQSYDLELKTSIIGNLISKSHLLGQCQVFNRWKIQSKQYALMKQIRIANAAQFVLKRLVNQKNRKMVSIAFQMFKRNTHLNSRVQFMLKSALKTSQKCQYQALIQAFHKWSEIKRSIITIQNENNNQDPFNPYLNSQLSIINDSNTNKLCESSLVQIERLRDSVHRPPKIHLNVDLCDDNIPVEEIIIAEGGKLSHVSSECYFYNKEEHLNSSENYNRRVSEVNNRNNYSAQIRALMSNDGESSHSDEQEEGYQGTQDQLLSHIFNYEDKVQQKQKGGLPFHKDHCYPFDNDDTRSLKSRQSEELNIRHLRQLGEDTPFTSVEGHPASHQPTSQPIQSADANRITATAQYNRRYMMLLESNLSQE